MTSDPSPAPQASQALKRALDLVVSALLLAILLPLLLLIALLVAVGSPGGALFVQERIGRGGRPFPMYKFRSMVKGADRSGPYHTSVNDARITPLGKLLRATSLDELPQLFNVLRGDMSLVGPRPDVPAQKLLYNAEEWRLRHCVRPGVTGLAQVVARNTATHEERVALDLEYVRSASLVTDIAILARTARNLIIKRSY
ncbi:sugar transferase [Oleiharenicola lentus]|uniref:Sugar transferase n=1 Tax=Oleiharenicola lentus TaxID=2508720 RepID=A0A4Q1C9P5_9BACT|nr:sugar transferase [Oleiharenicola lentus]RXK55725.1 sugar transferase [Oleiharenicola lentus]